MLLVLELSPPLSLLYPLLPAEPSASCSPSVTSRLWSSGKLPRRSGPHVGPCAYVSGAWRALLLARCEFAADARLCSPLHRLPAPPSPPSLLRSGLRGGEVLPLLPPV